jgi:hypothetical protein
VNWGRKWGCGAYENAQIITFSFDKMPSGPRAKEAAADFVLTTPNRLLVDPKFISYAFLLDPGKYALSHTKVKAARSASDVGHFTADRSLLLKDGESHGRFHVDAGETVYIGSFFLDCYQQPQLWRYYTIKEEFPGQVDKYKKAYPFLDLNNVIYRLFETDVFGLPYK